MGLIVEPMPRAELVATAPAPITYPMLGYAGRLDGKVVAYGGLMWRWERCDMWLEVKDASGASAWGVVHWGRAMLKVAVQMGETEVYCLRDAHEPNSMRLLAAVGFKPYGAQNVEYLDGTSGDKELWRWIANRSPLSD